MYSIYMPNEGTHFNFYILYSDNMIQPMLVKGVERD
jgi:hypothetical protein